MVAAQGIKNTGRLCNTYILAYDCQTMAANFTTTSTAKLTSLTLYRDRLSFPTATTYTEGIHTNTLPYPTTAVCTKHKHICRTCMSSNGCWFVCVHDACLHRFSSVSIAPLPYLYTNRNLNLNLATCYGAIKK